MVVKGRSHDKNYLMKGMILFWLLLASEAPRILRCLNQMLIWHQRLYDNPPEVTYLRLGWTFLVQLLQFSCSCDWICLVLNSTSSPTLIQLCSREESKSWYLSGYQSYHVSLLIKPSSFFPFPSTELHCDYRVNPFLQCTFIIITCVC